jgi:hypothetical protein
MSITPTQKMYSSEYIEVPLDEPGNDLIDLTSIISFDDHPEPSPLTGRCSKASLSKTAFLITLLLLGFGTMMGGVFAHSEKVLFIGAGVVVSSIAPLVGFCYKL